MIEAMTSGLLHLSPMLLLWVLVAVVVTTIIAVIPGLGGLFALVMLLPLVNQLPQDVALAMLMGSIAVAGTGNTITGVLFGVPGSASGVATIFDGYPMAKRGEGTRAISAGLTASAVGGIVGAIILALVLPFMRQIALALSSSEFFAMIVVALVFMAYVGEGSTVKALVAGLLGLMLSFVGVEISTGTSRYTFGELYLFNGIRLVPMMIGLFAIAEMLLLLRSGRPIAGSEDAGKRRGQVRQGMRDVFVHWRVTLQSSATGSAVGFAPGLGAVAAQFLAYTQALKTSSRGNEYGTGVVEGVIASDAATNSKDGSSLVPSLAFGIPGSAPMAVLLAALIAVGIQPGPQMLTEHLDIVWMFIWVLIVGNVMAAVLCLSATGMFARVAHARPTALAPPVLVISLFGAYATSNHIGDIWTALVFGLVGYVMAVHRYSRATLTIGFVLGILLERHFLLAIRVHGIEFLLRPITLGILTVGLLIVVVPLLKSLLRRSEAVDQKDASADVGR